MTEPMLKVQGLSKRFGGIVASDDIALDVAPGELHAIIGPNGAGKTTLIAQLTGEISPNAGSVLFAGEDITRLPPWKRSLQGLARSFQITSVFHDLTVLDNLRLGAHRAPSRAVAEERLAQVYDLFPILRERTTQLAGTMSGGQQRMLSVGIALMSGPRLLLLDEPSLGLAPALVEQMMAVIGRLAREDGLSVLLVEQNVPMTLAIADKAYFMRSGQIILGQSVEELAGRTSYWDLF